MTHTMNRKEKVVLFILGDGSYIYVILAGIERIKLLIM